MPLVAGVDFGTQSVRVSIVDSEKGVIGHAVSEYPVVRDRNDPDFATQSHASHMSALVGATHGAITDAGVRGRRKAMLAGAGMMTAPAMASAQEAAPLRAMRNTRYAPGRDITGEREATTFNNYYEFGSDKGISRPAQRLPQRGDDRTGLGVAGLRIPLRRDHHEDAFDCGERVLQRVWVREIG